ncbi:helix-turn-helix domain-containing protein [Weissella cibaria]|uniref:helix-turn-helix transcriptional regulator n=1 Tax=Weissella cibaria TaxID=137591 RepID=UPI001C1F7763|nr:helix-turn-helix transcriptional regulator [Weissella cibaria]MBU7560817.1 helix-turn-helix domain-containing protein [Weissella cibaria]
MDKTTRLTLAANLAAGRQQKNVSIEDIERIGISKSRYYRYINGEVDITVADLHKLLELLSMSFSEALYHTVEEADIIQNREISVLTNLRSFTIVDMAKLAIDGQAMDAKTFWPLYQTFVKSIVLYREYMPSTFYEVVLSIHLLAVQKYIIIPKKIMLEKMLFVIDAINHQPTRSSNVEMRSLKRLLNFINGWIMSGNDNRRDSIENFLAAARRLQIDVITMNDLQVSMTDIWTKSQTVRETGTPTGLQQLSYYAEIVPPFELTSIGDYLHQVIRDKRIKVQELAQYGFSKTKVYRMYDDDASFRVNDLLTLMPHLGLMPGDLDAVVPQFNDATYRVKYNLQFVAETFIPTAVAQAKMRYDETGHLGFLEQWLELRMIIGSRLDGRWYASEEAKSLGQQAQRLLQSMDTWHDSEFRILKLAWMAVDSVAGVHMMVNMTHANDVDNILQRTYANRVVEGVEYAIFKAMFEGNQELLDALLQVAFEEQKRDDKALKYASWRWRFLMYENYRTYFTNPEEAVGHLVDFFADYDELVGEFEITDKYKTLFNAMWREHLAKK